MPRLMNSLNTENSIHCDNNIIIDPASPPQDESDGSASMGHG